MLSEDRGKLIRPLPELKPVLGSSLVRDQAEPARPAPLSRAGSLAELDKEFVVFTPAILFRLADLPADPFVNFCEESKCTEKTQVWIGNEPFFSGLSGSEPGRYWDRSLLLLPQEVWGRYLRYLRSLVMFDRGRQRTLRIVTSEVLLWDPLWLQRERLLLPGAPVLKVVALGLESAGWVYFLANGNLAQSVPPRFRSSPHSHKDVRALQHALLSEDYSQMEHGYGRQPTDR